MAAEVRGLRVELLTGARHMKHVGRRKITWRDLAGIHLTTDQRVIAHAETVDGLADLDRASEALLTRLRV